MYFFGRKNYKNKEKKRRKEKDRLKIKPLK